MLKRKNRIFFSLKGQSENREKPEEKLKIGQPKPHNVRLIMRKVPDKLQLGAFYKTSPQNSQGHWRQGKSGNCHNLKETKRDN